MPRKILLLTISYSPVLNSAARLFSELAEHLKKKSFCVTVITSMPQRYVADDKEKFPEEEELNGVKVYRLPMISLPKRVPLLRGFEHFFVAFQYWLKGRRLTCHDAVIVYSPPLPLTMAGIKLAQKWKGISIVNVQDLYPQSVIDLGLLKNPLLISLARWIERWAYRYADFITVHSEGNRKYVIEHGVAEDRAYVVPNWVDLEKYRPGPLKNSLRERLGLADSFVVSYAGVMGFAQGVDDILKAAAPLEKEIRNFALVLAGSGVELPKLKKLSQDLGLKSVHFLPHLPEEEYIELLQASDACLVTLVKSLRTPVVPGKLQCIMAVERPAICSTPATSDAKRILEESKAGIWADAGDYDALARAIFELYSDSNLRGEMGRKGRLYAEEHFDKEKCIDQYIQLLAGAGTTVE
ncbi:glycosyltransferase family 4 protein [Acetomicrobium sp. S15 = DSM 107314]|uniref:glycosyltransferase family 4 protein n=1 Tax=Acetomicrobium sp. S15 = DSM 107314 TaxID=2529858 RepID=UPI0018E13622|nr:glycosyltransferase family 4 protein [Acetomicrobium sp. S15 = DSM 107314]